MHSLVTMKLRAIHIHIIVYKTLTKRNDKKNIFVVSSGQLIIQYNTKCCETEE